MIRPATTSTMSSALGSAAALPARSSNSRPAMHIADGTGRVSASTLARQSRAGSSPSSEPPAAKVIIQVPVEMTVKGTDRRSMCGSRLALLSWMPATTRQSPEVRPRGRRRRERCRPYPRASPSAAPGGPSPPLPQAARRSPCAGSRGRCARRRRSPPPPSSRSAARPNIADRAGARRRGRRRRERTAATRTAAGRC